MRKPATQAATRNTAVPATSAATKARLPRCEAREDASRGAERRRLAHDIARKEDADRVAEHRHEADQRVQAYGEARPGDRDRAVEQPREPGKALADLPGKAALVHTGLQISRVNRDQTPIRAENSEMRCAHSRGLA